MTPVKCRRHELRPGELGDSPRYVQALRDARSCWRCGWLARVAIAKYRWDQRIVRVVGQ
jgi:hypothetical protein